MPKLHSWTEFTAVVLTWTFSGAGMACIVGGIIFGSPQSMEVGKEWIQNAMMIGFGTPVAEYSQKLFTGRREDAE